MKKAELKEALVRAYAHYRYAAANGGGFHPDAEEDMAAVSSVVGHIPSPYSADAAERGKKAIREAVQR